ncbi:MAG: hypothetical protein GXY19_15970 [Phycisphaerae bacterium]|nr:hypothetical protein [Phycisphaerae bacterium]
MRTVRERSLIELVWIVAVVAFIALAYLDGRPDGAELPGRVSVPAEHVDQVERLRSDRATMAWWNDHIDSVDPVGDYIADANVAAVDRQRAWQIRQKVRSWWATFASLDDPNVCLQPVWIGPAPFPYDPNMIQGLLIDCHAVTAGKFNRTRRVCDPDGDPVDVELLAGPAGMEVTQDLEASTWTLAGELAPGLHAIVVCAIDRPLYGDPNETIVTILVDAERPPNAAPVLY